ncbi:TetR/AcrR family transcriptional regulator [Pandoraea sp.]|uniref:TetR family transcriptional regulator n=2 Tax=Burkholderiaceae TaxID=119060 RepID=A0A0G3EX35_9BURK|nr:TetR/AcrR family transcriptional regulator [Pandoraea sp.]AKJ69346.1 TetR family transcriptional regulator [Pandoraea thiooxydans]APR96968.1 TetR family transcriptional regulator [Pandoraea thiooxydans]TAL52216.1 MAG: TetR/AcrR family transcriptional regulator [Pandoraea sp.]TAM17303.1 MAG: TetR/AcrR family transcriptional regulator [Pandoraea sp.]
MARTRAENFDDIKLEILTAAAHLFAQKGFRNTNIIEIGAACNASKSRMYHYFPSKEAMLEAMLLDHVNGLLIIARDITASKLSPEEKMRQFVLAHLHYYFGARDRHKVLLADAEYLPEATLNEVRHAEQGLVKQLEALLKELNPKKFASRIDTSTHAMLIYGMLNWTYTWYEPTGKLNLKDLAQKAADMCLHGVL